MKAKGKFVPARKNGRPRKPIGTLQGVKIFKVSWENELESLLEKTYQRSYADVLSCFGSEQDFETDNEATEFGKIRNLCELDEAINANFEISVPVPPPTPKYNEEDW
jgi:hypothetical protein